MPELPAISLAPYLGGFSRRLRGLKPLFLGSVYNATEAAPFESTSVYSANLRDGYTGEENRVPLVPASILRRHSGVIDENTFVVAGSDNFYAGVCR